MEIGWQEHPCVDEEMDERAASANGVAKLKPPSQNVVLNIAQQGWETRIIQTRPNDSPVGQHCGASAISLKSRYSMTGRA
jgi:hypothetical protein